MKLFFENSQILEKLRELPNPSHKDFEKYICITKDDKELALYFYDKLNHGWLGLLEGTDEFEVLDKKEPGVVERYKTEYLFESSEANPEIALRIIKKINAQDGWIKGKIIGALNKTPEKIASDGVNIVLKYINNRERINWYMVGEESAILMIKLLDNYPEESFKIARALLDIWRPREGDAGIYERIRYKFATHEYKELIFKYYKKIWEERPFDAVTVLIDLYDKYNDEVFQEKGYDVSEYLGVSLRDLEDDYHLDRDVEVILVKAICEAGRLVIDKQHDRINELLDDLENRNKGVFHRVGMHLLRFVPTGTESDRINKILANQAFINGSFYKYEHRHLLNDKFDEVSKETCEKFIEWISKIEITEERKKEATEWCQNNKQPLPDFVKWENQIKAQELFIVKERFMDLYNEYKAKSGLSDSALAPRPIYKSETRCVPAEEGSSYPSNKMNEDSVEDVINYLLDPKNYEAKKEVSGWGTTKDALAESFKIDVKKRYCEYLKLDVNKLKQLDPHFLSRVFYGIWDVIREGCFQKEYWSNLINLMQNVVQDNHKNNEYQNCFSSMLSTLRDGVIQKNSQIEFNNDIVGYLLDIISKLVKYNEEYKYTDDERNPMQMYCNSVKGQATEQIVMLGIESKNLSCYDGAIKKEIRELMEYVINEVKKPEVNCMFGAELNRIGYFDEDWLKSNIEKIFEGDMWDVVWGTHVSWGRPYKPGFNLLKTRGIYNKAVEKLDISNKYKFGKDPNEGFTEHLMIGYFNGWITLDDPLLVKYFNKATSELRGYAARFLTTGFKSINEEGGEEKEKVAERMRKYWNWRLDAIKDRPKENEEEAIELTGWVDDSVLPPKETLELLEKSLEISGGNIGKMRDAEEFVQGVCKLGKGNELIALRCLNYAVSDENLRMPWVRYQKQQLEFLKTIIDLPNEYNDLEAIIKEAIEVADLYGRILFSKNYQEYYEVWESLGKKQDGGK